MKQAILFLDQQSWCGGGQRVLENVLEALEDDFQPIVAFPNHGPFRDALAARGIETLSIPFGSYRAGKKSVWDALSFALLSFWCVFRLVSLILNRKLRLVYINGPRCLPAGVLAARLTGRPSLFHLHMVLTRRPEILVVSVFARLATKIVACSNAAATSLIDACPFLQSKIEVMYNPVADLPFVKPSFSSSPHFPFTIGMVGRITQGKGQHVLIEAFSKLSPERQKSCRLVFVGAPGHQNREDDIYFTKLKQKSRALGLDSQIIWTGFQSDVTRFYNEMDVLAFPSVETEGLPLVVLEAMQRGIPVIATNTGGTVEIVEHGKNGLVVLPGDADELAKALTALMTDAKLLSELGGGARAAIDKRFSPSRFAVAIRHTALDLSPPAHSPHAIQEHAGIEK